MDLLDRHRTAIASRVKALRKERRWTQAQLAAELGITQARISQIEGGRGSFTAEQLVRILQLFNVPITSLVAAESDDEHAQLQNALARHGATHLREVPDIVPDRRFDDLANLVEHVLLLGDSRLLTALAPVLVKNIDRINLAHLHALLKASGLDRRYVWLLQNVRPAIVTRWPRVSAAHLRRRYRRAGLVLDTFLDSIPAPEHAPPRDILDPDIRAPRTVERIATHASHISRSWSIVTALAPTDFAAALEHADATD